MNKMMKRARYCWSLPVATLLGVSVTAQTDWIELDDRLGSAMATDMMRGEAVAFGGRARSGAVLGDTWICSGTAAWRPSLSGGPAPRSDHVMAAAANGVYLHGGRSALGGLLGDTWFWDGSTWLVVPGPGPSPRHGAAMAGDPSTGSVVLYGGSNGLSLSDTWLLQNGVWQQLQLATTPGMRSGHVLARTETADRFLLFGGEDHAGVLLQDTWRFDVGQPVQQSTWSLYFLAPAFRPAARVEAVAAFDAASQAVTLHGGFDGAGAPIGDVWRWDASLSAWQQCPGAATGRGDHAMAGLPQSPAGDLVVLGGDDAGAQPPPSVLLSNCAQLPAAPVPADREAPAMAFDAARGVTVMFGGWIAGSGPTDELWELRGNSWSQILPGPTWPGPRFAAHMCYDPVRQRVVMVGGYLGSGCPTLKDTWEWDGTAWSQKPDIPIPLGTAYAQMVFCEHTGECVLPLPDSNCGGRGTWRYDGQGWHSAPMPLADRIGFGVAYDRRRERLVLFGGSDLNSTYGDTWEWDGATWVQRMPPLAPSPRRFVKMAYDRLRGRVVMFGGEDGSGVRSDVWEWDGATWHPRSTMRTPPTVSRYDLSYDPGDGTTILFGHGNGSAVWRYGPRLLGTAERQGLGCNGGAGVLRLVAEPLPHVGGEIGFRIENATTSAAEFVAVGSPVQLPVGPLGPGCDQLVTPNIVFYFQALTLTVNLPNLPAFVGTTIHAQGITLDISVTSAPVSTSDRLALTIGGV
ncbi:MAG: hypothetical protein KDE27_03575 [Planctomycetes bacterium]|nr:hypothetical protein [Planctomycetota bacterium]